MNNLKKYLISFIGIIILGIICVGLANSNILHAQSNRRNDIQEVGSIDGITVYRITVDGIPYIMNSKGGMVRHHD